MASFKPTDLWEASPHTLAKLEIIGRYLDVWFMILGSNPNNRRLVYIDGFAGPGHYTNTDKSSPLVALQAAKAAVTRAGVNGSAIEYSFLFVEKKAEFAKSLEEVIQRQSLPPQFKWTIEQGSFEDKVGSLLLSLKERGTSLAPTFAFIDPFGATGLPFKVISEILEAVKFCSTWIPTVLAAWYQPRRSTRIRRTSMCCLETEAGEPSLNQDFRCRNSPHRF